MTRRPILIGTAAIFALILTAGLAYGSGWMQDAHPRRTQSVQMVRTHMSPGYGWDHRGQGWRQGPTAGNHYDGWMPNHHNRHGGSWAGMTSGHRSNRYDHHNGTRVGFGYDHHDAAHSGAGTYEHHHGSYGNGDWHDCW